jgi:hypothetical protein
LSLEENPARKAYAAELIWRKVRLVRAPDDAFGRKARGITVGESIMQRIAKILAAMVFAAGILTADAAWAHGLGGGWGGGGWHGGWGGGGWHGGWGGGWYGGWGYPYYGYGYPYDFDYDYGYGYPYGYPPPAPGASTFCATRARVCTLRHPREIGSGCSCRGRRARLRLSRRNRGAKNFALNPLCYAPVPIWGSRVD